MRALNRPRTALALIALTAFCAPAWGRANSFAPSQQAAQQSSTQTQLAKPVGTVKSINGKNVTLTTDSGAEVTVAVDDSTRIVRAQPGQKDLSKATALQLSGLEVGDRVLARGNPSGDGKSVTAVSMIVMKKADVDAMKQHEREDWAKRGIGGIVSSVDQTAGTISLVISSFAGSKTVTIHTTKSTIIRRYAPDSVKFDDAKVSSLSQINPGDQLRARGARSDDGSSLDAEEIVSGTFQNIAGPITAVDTNAKTVTVSDILSKTPMTVKVSADSQVRTIPPMMAQMIAMRFKGGAAGTPGAAPGGGAASSGNAASGANAGQRPAPSGASQSGAAPGGAPGQRPGGGGGLDQLLGRLPPASISDLQKGNVVMIVATEKDPSGNATAISMLSGVDAILTASPGASQAMLLAPWNLSAPSGGDNLSQ
jgi:Domain of unknown function (DUF5666)